MRLNVSENATAKGVASTAPLVKSRSVTSREEIFKDTCRWRGPFWLSLDLSTLIFQFWRLTLWNFFLKLTLSRSVHADFFFWTPTLEHFLNCFAHKTSTSEQQSSSTVSTVCSSGWTLIKLILWLNLSTKNIDLFYSRTFWHLFRRFDVTLHSPLKIRQAR